ncbi:uncharacterized protein [Dysidea avara]|uniref:uncharacterized protein isoform X2 n=1 Tax=Dysidea avara TaxID=196820 RepID=UPI00331EC971
MKLMDHMISLRLSDYYSLVSSVSATTDELWSWDKTGVHITQVLENFQRCYKWMVLLLVTHKKTLVKLSHTFLAEYKDSTPAIICHRVMTAVRELLEYKSVTSGWCYSL